MKFVLATLSLLLIANGQTASAGTQLDQLTKVIVKKSADFTSYTGERELKGSGSLYSSGQAENVTCSLNVAKIGFKDFRVVKTEEVGGEPAGLRFYVSPKGSIELSYKTSSIGVEEVQPTCNGEPELCEHYSHYEYRTIVVLSDKNKNEWQINCLANFSRDLRDSDVNIKGIEIK